MEVNFDNLDFNLFSVFGLDSTCSEKDIKKNYKKLLVFYHPDKNKNNQQATEMLYKINLSYKILSNPEHRVLYENYIKWKHGDHHNNFKNTFVEKDNKIQKKFKNMKEINEFMNKKHGIGNIEEQVLTQQDISNRVSVLKNDRNSVVIEKKHFKSMEEEINKEKKKNGTRNCNTIVNYKPHNNNNITTIDSDPYNNIFGGGNDKNVTTLEDAFKIGSYINYVDDGDSLENKLKKMNEEREKNLFR